MDVDFLFRSPVIDTTRSIFISFNIAKYNIQLQKKRKRDANKKASIKNYPRELKKIKIGIDSLDDYSLAKVFSYLTKKEKLLMEDVCERWRYISSELSWYQTKDFITNNLSKTEHEYQQVEVEKILIRAGRFMEQLYIRYNCDSSIMPIVAENCHQLYILSLNLTSYNKKYFKDVFKNMTHLKYIIFLNEDNIEIDEEIFENLPTGIEYLDISKQMQDKKILSINFANTVKKLTCLKTLKLYNWTIAGSVMEEISKLPELNSLSLNKSKILDKEYLLAKMINLTELELNSVKGKNNNNLITQIIKNCCNLSILDLSNLQNINSESLSNLPCLENLKYLTINKSCITDRILSNLRNIATLSCNDCRQVTDNGVINLVKNCQNLEKLSILRTRTTTKIIKFFNSYKMETKNELDVCIDDRLFKKYSKMVKHFNHLN